MNGTAAILAAESVISAVIQPSAARYIMLPVFEIDAAGPVATEVAVAERRNTAPERVEARRAGSWAQQQASLSTLPPSEPGGGS